MRVQLEGMKPSALQKRAIDEGCDERAVDEAMDSDDPRYHLVALLMGQIKAPDTTSDAVAALTAELKGLKPSALRRRAR